MLFVGVFGRRAGIAGAGLSTVPTEHAGVPPAQACEVAAMHHDEAEDPHASPANPNGQDFRDKAGVSMPAPKAALDDVQTDALIPQVVATALPPAVFKPVQLPVPRRDGVRAPPIPMPKPCLATCRLARSDVRLVALTAAFPDCRAVSH